MSEALWDKLAKAKTSKTRRIIKKKLPRFNEGAKKVLLLEGGKSSQTVKDFLQELHTLKKGQAARLSRKNEQVRPMEAGGEVALEFLCQKNECGLFAVASHSKKRPHNIVLGRMFDYHLYDVLEVGVEDLKTMKEFGNISSLAAAGSKPCITFMGEGFETQPELMALQNILTDLFRGEVVDNVALSGLDRVIAVAESEGKVYVRQCAMKFKKSGTRIPRVELQEMGPSCTLTVRRHKAAAKELEKEACKKVKVKKIKNTKVDVLGETYGRVYLPKQEVDEMALRKMKGLKRERREAAEEKAADKKQAAEKAAAEAKAAGGDAGEPEVRRSGRAKKAKVSQE